MEENQLITQLQQGTQVAFKHLVETYQNRVFNTVLAIVQDAGDAEDVSQEVFIEVYESVNKFKGEAKLSTWLYRIATTKALEAYRKRKTQKRFAFFTSLFGDDNEVRHHTTNFEHPGVVLENQERATVLFKHIEKLPDNQKVAFTLCHVEGLSYQEIMEVMQTSLSSVESLLFRAKTNLRKSLKSYYEQTLME